MIAWGFSDQLASGADRIWEEVGFVELETEHPHLDLLPLLRSDGGGLFGEFCYLNA